MYVQADLVFEAGSEAMGLLQGAYSCICLVHGVGTVAFRDPYGIRWDWLRRRLVPSGRSLCSCICLVHGVGTVAFRDFYSIR